MLPEKFRGEHIHVVAAMSVRPDVRQSVSLSVRQSVRPTRVRPKTSLFEVRFRNYFTEMTTMLKRRVERNILSPYLEGQGLSATLQQNRVRPITLLFKVGFQKYFTEMITILR